MLYFSPLLVLLLKLKALLAFSPLLVLLLKLKALPPLLCVFTNNDIKRTTG